MKRILRNAGSIVLIAVLSILVFSTVALAAEVPGIRIPVTMKLSSYKPNTPEELVVVLTAKDETCPMPEGTVDGKYSMKVSGEGVKEFPEITFPKVGIHEYTIHQEKGSHSRGTYDDTVYHVTIYVTNAEDGSLETTILIYVDGVEEKQGEVIFKNSYRRPSSGGYVSDPVKPAVKVEEPGVQEELQNDGKVSVDIIEDRPLFVVLPQTGTLWWLVPILGCAGVMMFLTGFLKNRSCKKDEE